MVNGSNRRNNLDEVNMFIRALAAEVHDAKAEDLEDGFPSAIKLEMEQALYELRLRKLLISALGEPDRADKTTGH
jgi:hypothetical protein